MSHRNPPTAVDLLIEIYQGSTMQGIVLIRRGNEPYKGRWALPGGFQEVGESLEETAAREGKEETGLDLKVVQQLKVYSHPKRDPRGHVNAIGFIACAYGRPKGGDDAAEAQIFPLDKIPHPLAFDHDKRIEEYKTWKKS